MSPLIFEEVEEEEEGTTVLFHRSGELDTSRKKPIGARLMAVKAERKHATALFSSGRKKRTRLVSP
jgi:hypothetical protein